MAIVMIEINTELLFDSVLGNFATATILNDDDDEGMLYSVIMQGLLLVKTNIVSRFDMCLHNSL